MFFKRIFTPSLSIYSYLLGDEKTKRCIVIDPVRQVAPYIVQAQAQGLTITDIVETHVHADFVSGSRELKHQLNEKPTIHVSGMGGSQWVPHYADQVVQQGSSLIVGNIRLEALHTPGHTPEHIVWICYDLARSADTPWFAFTGDLLFVGSVGRPDLLGQEALPALAKQLYRSLFQELALLPDFVEILPAHGLGTLCGKTPNGRETSTLGYERLFNPYLKKQTEEKWMEDILKDLPPAPPYFRRLKTKNVEGPALLSTLKTLKEEKETNCSWNDLFLLDIRHPEAFAMLHLAKSLNIPLSPSFCHWAGWMLPENTPLGLVVQNSHMISDAIEQLRLIGFDQDIHVINLDEVQPEKLKDRTASFAIIDVEELAKHQPVFESFYVIDVRTPSEWQSGHIPGARHLELNQLQNALQELPKDQSLVLVCRSGVRASLAASLLKKQGFPCVMNLRGGMDAWKLSNLPLAK